MGDMIRWLAKDVDDTLAGIERSEAQAARYDAEAERVAFDAEAQSYMRHWAARERQAADEGRLRLPVLKRRLEEVGG